MGIFDQRRELGESRPPGSGTGAAGDDVTLVEEEEEFVPLNQAQEQCYYIKRALWGSLWNNVLVAGMTAACLVTRWWSLDVTRVKSSSSSALPAANVTGPWGLSRDGYLSYMHECRTLPQPPLYNASLTTCTDSDSFYGTYVAKTTPAAANVTGGLFSDPSGTGGLAFAQLFVLVAAGVIGLCCLAAIASHALQIHRLRRACNSNGDGLSVQSLFSRTGTCSGRFKGVDHPSFSLRVNTLLTVAALGAWVTVLILVLQYLERQKRSFADSGDGYQYGLNLTFLEALPLCIGAFICGIVATERSHKARSVLEDPWEPVEIELGSFGSVRKAGSRASGRMSGRHKRQSAVLSGGGGGVSTTNPLSKV